MENNLTIKERILQLAKYKKFTIEDFCSKIGMTYGNFKGENKKTPINSTSIENIFSIVPDLNIEWLITGKGNMLISNNENSNKTSEPTANYKPPGCEYCAQKDKTIQALENNVEILNRYVRCLEAELDKKAPATEGAKKKGAA